MRPKGKIVNLEQNPFPALVVFDKLEIGPAVLQKNKVSAPYALFSRGSREGIEFVYKFEEDVFIPDEPESLNLASLLAAQVAINYGLFCKKIVFNGLYDEEDKKFIQSMMENTSREIYVKKFLEENPFILRDRVETPVLKLKKYTQAQVIFNPDRSASSLEWTLWSLDKDKYAVLSSGGKESLLSFGLLNETGRQVCPFFVNESGRHWFTALKAFRYFKDNVPNTARVWTNSDRIFNWILRRMPFIRQNHESLRADDYPVRLWTVAVFLFGVLPLLRKYKIGRLVIGDEYDTTVRTTWRDIPHYDGLYDQSRYFDNAMSRYFLKKGWGTTQFSLLRPLSELLVEKILLERYPGLQKYQTSCHATHKEGDQIFPCGRCEKCRRVIAMITAVGGDSRSCGYSEAQVNAALAVLASKGLHQEKEGVEHLRWMLKEKNIVLPPEYPAKNHPEILHLRFEKDRSPLDVLPLELRTPLYNIFLQHAAGSMYKSRKAWEKFDLMGHPDLLRPYKFDIKNKKTSSPPLRHRDLDQVYLWGELTWPEAVQRLEVVDVALLPVGAIEQHGPHLPLDTDAFDAGYLARKVAESCSRPRPLVLPPVQYGVSYHHDDFTGTISVSNDTLSHLVYEVGVSVAQNGIRKLLIINGHGGNTPALNFAAQMINRDTRIFVAVDTGETSDIDIEELAETPNDVHAGEIETSTAMAVRPHLVKMELAKKNVPDFSSRYLNFSSRRGVSWHAYTKKISANGIIGDPTKASVEKGEKMWKMMIAHLVALVEDLKNMTLEELYQRRY